MYKHEYNMIGTVFSVPMTILYNLCTLMFEFSCKIDYYPHRLQLTSVLVTFHHDSARLKVLSKILIDND